MRKILIGISLFLILGGVAFAQEVIPWGEVYYKYAYVHIEKLRIGMESLISFGKENGVDVSKLESLKDDFLTKSKELESACSEKNWDEVEKIEEDMKGIVESFKEESKKSFTGKKGARSALRKAYDENLSYLQDLLKSARELHKQRNLSLFDYAVSRAEEVIQKLKDYGKDTSLCEKKLSEIKAKRDNFESKMENVISSCATIYHLSCTSTTGETSCDSSVSAYCSLKNELENDFSELQDLIYQSAGIK